MDKKALPLCSQVIEIDFFGHQTNRGYHLPLKKLTIFPQAMHLEKHTLYNIFGILIEFFFASLHLVPS